MFNWGARTYIMGILNVTPDSFSDGGEFNTLEFACHQGLKLAQEGADILDIGGQSTRPMAVEISLAEELERVLPVVEALHSRVNIPLSVDTTRARVAREAVALGAAWINDVSGGQADPLMLTTVAQLGCPYVLMHRRGNPQTMQQLTDYRDLIGEIKAFFATQIAAAWAVGVERSQLILDPGIGFAKTLAQNLELIRNLGEFREFGLPILVGVSRKSFIGQILGIGEPKERLWGTAAACAGAIAAQADILRVHDVAPMRDVAKISDALWRSN